MRMLFVADLHYTLRQFDWLVAHAPQFDPVIIGGDLLDLSSALDLDVQIVVVGKYLERLRQLTRVVVSSGNHDGDGHDEHAESVARWIRDSRGPQLHVDGDAVELEGTLVTVCPWWDGPVSRARLEAQLARDAARPKARWVWVHHAPPAGSPVCWAGKKAIGDDHLAAWIREYQPDLVLSGHIHNAPFYPQGSWIDRLGRTWVFNPGRQPGPEPTHLAVDLEAMTVEWVSVEGPVRRELGPAAAGVNEPPLPLVAAGA